MSTNQAKPMPIVLIVLGGAAVLLCGCAVIAIGAGVIFNAINRTNTIAEGGLGDDEAKADVWEAIKKAERAQGCDFPVSLSILITQPLTNSGEAQEIWTVDGCGMKRSYQVDYQALPEGGAYFVVSTYSP